MADAIRDVVIRVAVQQAQATFNAPSGGGGKGSGADSFEKQRIAAEKQLEAMAEKGRVAEFNRINDLSRLRASAAEKTAAIEQAAAEKSKAARLAEFNRINDLAKQRASIAEKAAQAEEDAARKRAEAEQASENATRHLNNSTQKAAQAFRGLAESTGLVIRGVALLGASNEKDLQKVLKTLVEIQAGFDLFKGGIGILQNVAKAYDAIAKAAAAAAIAQKLSGAASVAGGAGSLLGGAKTLLAGFGAGTGATFAAGAAASIGVGAGIGFGIVKGTGLDLSGDFASRDQSEDRAIRMQLARSRNMGFRLNREASALQAGQGWASSLLGLRGGSLGEEAALAQRQATEAAAFGARARDEGGRAGNALATGQATKAAIDAQLSAEERVLQVRQKQTAELERQREARMKSIQSAEDELRVEKERVKTVQTGLGGLRSGEATRLKQLADKAKAGGEFNETELDFIEGAAGESEFTREQRQKSFRAKFGESGESIAQFLNGRNLTGAGSRQEELERAVADAIRGDALSPGLEQLAKEINEARAKEVEQWKKVGAAMELQGQAALALETLVSVSESMRKRIERIEATLHGGE